MLQAANAFLTGNATSRSFLRDRQCCMRRLPASCFSRPRFCLFRQTYSPSFRDAAPRHPFRTVLGSKTCSFLSPPPGDKNETLGLRGAEKFSALSHVLSQRTPTRSHAAGFGDMTLKTDDPTGVNSNGATANERKRAGVSCRYSFLLNSK